MDAGENCSSFIYFPSLSTGIADYSTLPTVLKGNYKARISGLSRIRVKIRRSVVVELVEN